MFRFTIRDVLWLMVVVGMGVGWWADRVRFVHPLAITGRTLDLAIEGEGFFNLDSDTSQIYSRCGQFSLDRENRLVVVLGGKEWIISPHIQIPADAISVTVNAAGVVVAQLPSTVHQSKLRPGMTTSELQFVQCGQLQLSLFDQPHALREVSPLVYTPTKESGIPLQENPGREGAGLIRQGMLERAAMSR